MHCLLPRFPALVAVNERGGVAFNRACLSVCIVCAHTTMCVCNTWHILHPNPTTKHTPSTLFTKHLYTSTTWWYTFHTLTPYSSFLQSYIGDGLHFLFVCCGDELMWERHINITTTTTTKQHHPHHPSPKLSHRACMHANIYIYGNTSHIIILIIYIHPSIHPCMIWSPFFPSPPPPADRGGRSCF